MPIRDAEDNLPDRQSYADFSSIHYSVADVARATVDMSPVAKIADALFAPKFEPDPEYNVYEDPEVIENYAGNLSLFSGVESRSEARYRMRLQNEKDANVEAAANGGVAGAATNFIVGSVTDPLMYVPLGGAAYNTYRTTGRIFEGAARTAAIVSGVVAAEQIGLQAIDPTHTDDETINSITGAAFLSGILGGAAGAFGGKTPVKTFNKLADDIEAEMRVPTYNTDGSLSAAQTPTTTLKQEALKSITGLGDKFDVNAPGWKGKINRALDYTLNPEKALAFTNPVLRLAISPFKSTRVLNERLAENVLEKVKHGQGIESAQPVSAKAAYHADAIRLGYYEARDKAFIKYRQSKSVAGTYVQDAVSKVLRTPAQKMTYAQFKEEINRAIAAGYNHDIPEVLEAAQAKKEMVLDPILKEAKAVGLFDEDIPDVPEEALAYINVLYDKAAIRSNPKEWADIVEGDIKEKRDQAKARLEPAKRDVAKMKIDLKAKEKDAAVVEDAARKAVIETVDKSMTDAVNKALADIEVSTRPEVKGKTLEQAQKQAKKKADAKRLQVLANELENDLAAQLDDMMKFTVDDLVKSVVDENPSIEGDEFFAFLKKQLDQPLGEESSNLASALVTNRLELATKKANAEAAKTFSKSLKNQMTRIAKKGELSDYEIEKLIVRRVQNDIRLEAMKAAQTAARDAGKALRQEIKDMVKAIEKKYKDIDRDTIKAALDDDYIPGIQQELTNRILGTTASRLAYENHMSPRTGILTEPGARGSAKKRKWKIDPQKTSKFRIQDDDVLTEAYVGSLVRDIEMMREFGTLNPKDIIKEIELEANEFITKAVNEGDNALAERLRKTLKKNTDDFTDMWERIRGVYGHNGKDDYANLSGTLKSAERLAMNLNFVSMLGGAIAQIPDIARPIMVHGVERTFRDGFVAMAKDWKGFKAGARDVREATAASDMVLLSTAQARANLDEFAPVLNKAERFASKTAHTFSVVSLMAPMNAVTKQFSGVITQSRFLRAALDLAEGKNLDSSEVAHLAANYMNPAMAKRVAEQFKKYGKEGDVLVPNARVWDDVEAQQAFRMGVRREVEKIIVTPGQDRPLLMSKTGWRALLQFRTFNLAATQRVLLAGLQQQDAAVLNGSLMIVGLGAMTYILRSKASGYEPDYDPRRLITEGVDRGGLLAVISDFNGISEKLTRGKVGLSALNGRGTMSRYASRSVLESVFGPTYGNMGNATQIIGSAFAKDWRMSDTHAVARLAPFHNLVGFRQLYEEAEANINEALGVEE